MRNFKVLTDEQIEQYRINRKMIDEVAAAQAVASSKNLAVDVVFKEGTALAKDFATELKELQAVADNWDEVVTAAAEALIPAVRMELEASWSRTGLKAFSQRSSWKGGDYSGAMYEGWVTKSTIKANHLGVLVYVAAGMADAVYARVGVYQHGGVFGAGKRGGSKSAERVKQKLKQGVKTNTSLGGGVRIVAPRPVTFDGGQIDRLAGKFTGLIAKEINHRAGVK